MTFESVTQSAQEDIVAYIATLSSNEAVCLAGAMVHELTKMTGNPMVHPVQLRATVSLYTETIRILLKHAVEQTTDRPAHGVYAGWDSLMRRVVNELNDAIAVEIGGRR